MKPNDDGEYVCPVDSCLHMAYKSVRGLRKHINAIHPWWLYFDTQPFVAREQAIIGNNIRLKRSTHKMPAFSLEEGIGKEFLEWLEAECGSSKSNKEAVQIGRRAMKFLMASMGEPCAELKVQEDYIDCCLGSPSIVIAFLKSLSDDWEIGSSARLSYLKAISELMDFRKSQGLTDFTLRNFTCTEVYIRKGKENLIKEKKLDYARNLDLETLIARDSWASLEEMQDVIPYHTPKFQYVLKKCKEGEDVPSVNELSFTTRFIATFLFLRVKCTRPMTIQFLTVTMVEQSKTNGGYIDSTKFKTHEKFLFDTLILSDDVICILDAYIYTIRPLLNPVCEYLLLTTAGTQYRAFSMAMSLLVHQSIGKYINPTRYRQIVESASALQLSPNEREIVSKDQKHGSAVARRIYQKRLSRDVAAEANQCMVKMVGLHGQNHTKELAASMSGSVQQAGTSQCTNVIDIENGKECDSGLPHTPASHGIEMGSSDSALAVAATSDINEPIPPVTDETTPLADSPITINIDTINIDELCDEKEVVACTDDDVKILEKAEDLSLTTEKHSDGLNMPASESNPCSSSSQPEQGQSGSLSIDAEKSLVTRDDIDVKKEELENEISRGLKLKRFTYQEDTYLKQGVTKHGLGRWSRILKDADYTFHQGRTRDSLRMRADTLKLTKKKSKAVGKKR